MVRAIVKQRLAGGIFTDWYFIPSDHDRIYEKMMEITNRDHEISDDAACWCELASVGETYGFCEEIIEIKDVEGRKLERFRR